LGKARDSGGTEVTNATGHEAWQDIWGREVPQDIWIEPDEDVVAMIPQLRKRNARRVLDIGCGLGRHVIPFAKEGFSVDGIDASTAGVTRARALARSSGVVVSLCEGSMLSLPYDADAFDYILAWHVIFHGDRQTTAQAIGEAARVLKPAGLFHFTLLSKKHFAFGRGQEVSPATFILNDEDRNLADEAALDDTLAAKEEFFRDRQHPHFYSNARDVLDLLPTQLELRSLRHVEHRPRSFHWEVIAELGN
jgi:SAM-dependent methyltransferase